MSLTTLAIKDRISYIEKWLLHSGIQAKEGGFYAWEDTENGSYSFLYPEITGYAIILLCFLYTITKDDIYISRAKSAARWIINEAAHPASSILTRKYIMDAVEHYSFERGNIYAFDCGMVAFGLLKLYRITDQIEYLNTAKGIIDFLINNMLKENGLIYPIYDSKNNKVLENNKRWSRQSGSFHCKLSFCLCELADIEKNDYYKNLAANLISSSVKHFYKGRRFITNISDESSHFHPYCYTIEGIIYYSYKLGDNKYRKAAEDAFDWILKFQESNGGIPTGVFEDGRRKIAHQRSDIQAQVLRLHHLLKNVNYAVNFDKDKLLSRLLQFQNLDQGYKGGFFFGTDEDGTYKKHSNFWCSIFALQALYLSMGKSDKNLVLDYLV